MPRITEAMIRAAYGEARRVHAGTTTEDDAVERLSADHAMNQASARIYIRNLPLMLSGKVLKRTLSAPSFEIYLKRIEQDYGASGLTAALRSLHAHTIYYATLGRGNLQRVEELVRTYGKRPTMQTFRADPPATS